MFHVEQSAAGKSEIHLYVPRGTLAGSLSGPVLTAGEGLSFPPWVLKRGANCYPRFCAVSLLYVIR